MINASRLVPEEGVEQVLIHGTPTSFIIGGETIEDGVELTPKQLAKYMYETGFESGTPVRLISCSTGVYGDGAAYQLSRYLNSPVIAPTARVGILPGGEYLIEDGGRWRTFFNDKIY